MYSFLQASHRESFKNASPSVTQLFQEQAQPHCQRYHRRRLQRALLPCVRSEFSVPGSPQSLPLSTSPSPDTSQPRPHQYCGLNNAIDSRAATSPQAHPHALASTLTPRSASSPIVLDDFAPAAPLSLESHLPLAHSEVPLIHSAGFFTDQ
jgi:hypothetical protein